MSGFKLFVALAVVLAVAVGASPIDPISNGQLADLGVSPGPPVPANP